MAQTIYNPEYMASLRSQVGTTRNMMEQTFQDLRSLYEGHGGLWQDAEANGPCATFGQLIADFQTVLATFLANLDTTSGNVQGYEEAMLNVSQTFNFAAGT
jgi:hypothetical protein